MMEQPIESGYCRKWPTTEFFESVVLDANVLTVAIVNKNDIYADDDDLLHQVTKKQLIDSRFFCIMATWVEEVNKWYYHVLFG